jgi:hypothetical protein
MKRLFLTTFALLFVFSSLQACRFTVREIGFADFGNDQYELVFLKDKFSIDEHIGSFEKISYAALLETNVNHKVVDVQNADFPWKELYKEAEPSLQKLALVSPGGDALLLKMDRNADNFREEIWTLLEQVLSSNTREKVLEIIVKNYAVVLIVESEDQEANQRAHQMVNKAVEEIKSMMANMPKPVDVPPAVIVVENENIESERVLLWGLGFEKVKESLPAITVLYGRGRQMGRLLPADIIKFNIVRNLLAFVGADCECGLDRSWILGRMVPIRWESDKQREVLQYHNFDAENPLIKAEMSQILSISPSKQRAQDKGALATEGLNGYTEKEIELVTVSPNEGTDQKVGDLFIPLKKSVMIIIGVLLITIVIGGILFYNSKKIKV